MIPVNEPFVGPEEIDFVLDCLQTSWISSAGKYIDQFEERWAAYCGRDYGIAVSNGTVALELALEALDLSPGEEVILPTFTIISCAQAVIYAGGTPVLVDADPDTWCMDVSQVEAKINDRTRAIMPVHIYGHPVEMDPLLDFAEHHDLVVIEDAAEAHGAEYLTKRGRAPTWSRAGSFGEVSCFSFYANKIVTTGEGGMILTDDPEMAERLRYMRNLCFEKERRFMHRRLGHNFRLTNIQAALGLGQFERIEKTLAHKRWLGGAYSEKLKDIELLQLPTQKDWARNVYWMYGLVLDPAAGMDAAEFAQRLSEEGVMTRPFFLGLHDQPVLREMGLFAEESYPVSDHIARQGLYLPSGQTLSEAQLEAVCAIVRRILGV